MLKQQEDLNKQQIDLKKQHDDLMNQREDFKKQKDEVKHQLEDFKKALRQELTTSTNDTLQELTSQIDALKANNKAVEEWI